jgi:catecholate siderophore receptor
MLRFIGISALAFCTALSTPVHAFEYVADDAVTDAVGDADCKDCRTIIVTGASTGYVAQDIVTATKTDTPLIDVPQSVHVVTRQQLDDQAQYSLGEVLRYVPGTTVGQGEGNRDQITLRGQNTTADFFLDGVRDDAQYYRGLYNIERVEILKGPFALIFGRGGGGGIINRVQKTPVAEAVFAATRASLNSFGGWDVSADLNSPLGNSAAVRINATYEKLEGDRRFVDGRRYAWNPYLAVNLNEAWKLGLSYEYVNDDRVTDRGVPSIATAPGRPNAPIRGFNRVFFGVPGVNRTTLEAQIVKARLDGEVADNLKFTSTLLYGDYDKLYVNAFANGAATSLTGTVALDAYSDPTKRQNFIGQANLIWDVQTGAVDHKLLFGLEYGDQHTRNLRLNRVFSPNNIFSLANPVYPSVTFTTRSRDTVSDVTFFSAYVQDQISIGEHFDIVAGLRYDHFSIKGLDFIPVIDRPFARNDNKLSPRLGLIWKPAENASIYASFSRSFLPRSGDQFISLAINQENLAPEQFTNYELGAKWDIKPDLNATLALFQLDRTNVTAVNPVNPLVALRLPGTRTKGVELALTGRVLSNWQVSAGYTYQDSYRSDDQSITLAQVPKHQLALWNRYDVSDAFGLGLGVVHQSSQFAALRTSATTTRLPSFTRVDAALFYDISEKVQLQANVENLFDTNYFADAHNNNNITPGAPINGRMTVRVKF